jgi:hypothetical protein
VGSIPFGSERFGKICTANPVYFRSSLEIGFVQLRRVLALNGRLAVGSFRRNG